MGNESRLPVIGGLIAAFGASLCCMGPLVLLILGVSGSWIGNLTMLEPYQPLFILAVVALFLYAGWQLYRPMENCKPGSACAIPAVRKKRQILFWISSLCALILITGKYWIIYFV